MQIESIKEGPFSVEIQSMEFVYNKKYDSVYEKYHLPIFLRVWKNLNTILLFFIKNKKVE